MSLDLTFLLQLPGVIAERCSELPDSLCIHLRMLERGILCPFCQNYTEDCFQNRPILLRDLPAFGRAVYLEVPRRQFHCKSCGRHPSERLAFADSPRRHTRRYEQFIYEQVEHTSIERVSREQGLGRDEVEGVFHYIAKRQKKTTGKMLST